MKKSYILLSFILFAFLATSAQDQLSCDFTVAAKVCINQEVKVLYTGGAPSNATYLWNFDGAVIISGSGAGPHYVKWETPGEKHVVLSITHEGLNCTATKPVVVIEQPHLFHMTGGGVLIPGTAGVVVGLSGSESQIIYKLRRNGVYTGVAVTGTGQPISFGAQNVTGEYTALARVDGSDCMREMEGVAVVTGNVPPVPHHICMVTFDTATNRNIVIWHKEQVPHMAHFNIYKEIYQNNVFEKIGEVPFNNLSVFVDPVSDPLVKSDKYKLSLTDSAGLESEKSPYHKTIHLNINPGTMGFNLIWNHYEGFEFKTYRIWRKLNAGAWQVIDSIASNVDSYTDFYTSPGLTSYYIEVLRPVPCVPSIKSITYAGVISNMAAAAPLGTDENDRTGILIFPNPASERINLLLPGNGIWQISVLRTDGVEIANHSVTAPSAYLNVADLKAGIYLLKISGQQGNFVRKFVRN